MPGQKTSILAIETSCDETACSVVAQNSNTNALNILSHQVHSQAKLHAEFGGVFPNLAKREHGKNFVPVLSLCLNQAFNVPLPPNPDSENKDENLIEQNPNLSTETIEKIKYILQKEHDLGPDLVSYLLSISPADFAHIKESLAGIAVTYGPGLEPALWVGISAAKALGIAFDLPLFPINHMEGHIASVLASTGNLEPAGIDFPAIALLISGGHTELVSIDSWHAYTLIGQTVDDAVGEAYDKVARLLGLPYPGGPEISKLADSFRSTIDKEGVSREFTLPRPMIHSKDLNFSFSGLKTAALYAVRDRIKTQNDEPLSQNQKEDLAAEFEQSVIEVLLSKTKKAILEQGSKSLIIGGGVISNHFIRENFKNLCRELNIPLLIPEAVLATDNASMIGLVALLQVKDGQPGIPCSGFDQIKAQGNLSFSK